MIFLTYGCQVIIHGSQSQRTDRTISGRVNGCTGLFKYNVLYVRLFYMRVSRNVVLRKNIRYVGCERMEEDRLSGTTQ